jgi:hypothetical protein
VYAWVSLLKIIELDTYIDVDIEVILVVKKEYEVEVLSIGAIE